jgi:hypothetical protein
VWLVFGAVLLTVDGLMAWGMVTQLALGNSWGDHAMPDVALGLLGGLVIGLSLVLAYALAALRLVIEVREDALYVRFAPFVTRRIPFSQIVRTEARTYSPVFEYGGWGIRWMPGRGWAYNVSGNRGVQLELSGRKKLMLGTRRPEQLARAIESVMSKS